MPSPPVGKKIRRIYGGFFAVACVLAGAMYHLHLRSAAVAHAFQRQAELDELGNELLKSSDYLTAEVRKYAQFGDVQHFENFWQEVRESRTRERVVKRLKELGVPQSELDLVEMAKANSDALVHIEKQAMDLTREGKFDDARKLLFLPHYDAAKAQITGPTKEFQRRAQDRTQAELARAQKNEWLAFLALSLAVVLVFALAVALASERRSLKAKLLFSDRMASLGTLAAGVAHELNNPLMYTATNIGFVAQKLEEHKRSSAILSLAGGAAMLSAQDLTDILTALRDALEGAKRAKTIVRDLKSFTEPDEESMTLVDVHRPLEAALEMCASEIRGRAQLTRNYGSPPAVHAVEGRLIQILRNLLMNAAQAIAEARPEQNEIAVVTRAGPSNTAVIEIRDTGVGIPKSIRNQIFDPFFTTKPIGVGTGLGLPICHTLLRSMGGEIEVDSEEGKGSTFRIILPGAAQKAPDAEAPWKTSASLPGQPGKAAESRRVLAIDDEPMVLAALRRALSPPHEITATTEGKEAVERIARGERFDVILCDMMMPNTTGMDVYQAVKQLAPEQLTRFVFLTGGAFSPRVREFLKELPTPLLEKPVSADRIRTVIAGFKRAN